ncbi:MAG: hypothetical protein ACK504_09755 [Bacteroidota bacterium]
MKTFKNKEIWDDKKLAGNAALNLQSQSYTILINFFILNYIVINISWLNFSLILFNKF